MSLYLQIGAYSTPVCTVRCTGRSLNPIEYNSFIIAHESELSFSGYLYAAGPGALTSSMTALDAAIKVPNPSVSLTSTATGVTSHAIGGGGSIGGVVLKEFRYVDTPLHMATQVKFEMKVSAIYSNSAETRSTVFLEEQIRYQGDGGPDVALAPQAGLKAIYQPLSDYTEVIITQTGKVVSRSTFVAIPSPVIATAGAKISRQTGRTLSYKQRGTSIWLYEQDYTYSFQLPEMPESLVVPGFLT